MLFLQFPYAFAKEKQKHFVSRERLIATDFTEVKQKNKNNNNKKLSSQLLPPPPPLCVQREL